jgi:hypothetical protein
MKNGYTLFNFFKIITLKNFQNIDIENEFTFSIWSYQLRIMAQINKQKSNWQMEKILLQVTTSCHGC